MKDIEELKSNKNNISENTEDKNTEDKNTEDKNTKENNKEPNEVQQHLKLISINEIENNIKNKNDKKNKKKVIDIKNDPDTVNKKLNNHQNADKLTNICKEIVNIRNYTENNFKDLVTIITGHTQTDNLYKTDYQKWLSKFDKERTLAEFYLRFDNNNKEKFVSWYATNKGKNIDETKNIMDYSIKIRDILDSDDELWSKLLNFTNHELQTVSIKTLHVYENRLAIEKTINGNKNEIYDLIMS